MNKRFKNWSRRIDLIILKIQLESITWDCLSILLTCRDPLHRHCKKLTSDIYLIRSLKTVVSYTKLKLVYHSIYMAESTYILVWGHSFPLSRDFSLQIKAFRIISNMGYRRWEDVRNVFKKLKFQILPCT